MFRTMTGVRVGVTLLLARRIRFPRSLREEKSQWVAYW